MHVAPAAAAHLAEVGYDERYGARPLKRALEREFLAPLAEALNAYADATALRATVEHSGSGVSISVRTADIAREPALERTIPADIVHIRRRVQRLERCTALREMLNEIDQLTRQVESAARRSTNLPELAQWQERLALLKPLAARIETLAASITALEDEALAIFYGEAPGPQSAWRTSIIGASSELWHLLVRLYALRFENPDRATLLFLGDHVGRSFELARLYHRIASSRGAETLAAWFARDARGRLRYRADDVPQFLAHPPKGVWALALTFSGELMMPLFAGEHGSHVFDLGKEQQSVKVLASARPIDKTEPPEGAERPGGVIHDSIRRTYRLTNGEHTDHVLDQTLRAPLADAVADFVNKSLDHAVEGLLDS